MIAWLRDFRLIPIVFVAIACLFALKTYGLVSAGGYIFSGTRDTIRALADAPSGGRSLHIQPPGPLSASPTRTKQSWAQEMFNFPDITGSVDKPASKETVKEAKNSHGAKKPEEPKPSPGGKVIPLPSEHPMSASERALLQRLQERREELETRARAMDVRETLIKAAEKKLEAKAAEVKQLQANLEAAMHKKDEAEAARFKGLVTMYETMKAKDAAKIFDRLDIKLATEVATQIKPRQMADILAQMSTEAAERLTVELANRNATDKGPNPADLPKIEGRPSGT